MGYVDKHFRLSEETCQKIKERDTRRFPLERDFINEAVLSYGDNAIAEQTLRELRDFKRNMETVFENIGWR